MYGVDKTLNSVIFSGKDLEKDLKKIQQFNNIKSILLNLSWNDQMGRLVIRKDIVRSIFREINLES